MNPALLIIFGTILFSSLLGVFAGRRVPMDLENWTVGGRRFGVLLIWLLMAGETYTTFTFLGASGWAYSKGAPAFYILVYGTLAYTLSFFVLPVLWKVGKKHGLQTQPDYFIHRYGSRGLGVFVSLIGGVCIIPYLELQLAGLGFIVNVASRGAISASLAIIISFVLTCLFVLTSGIRGAAWVAVVKDIMMLIAVAVVGLGVPVIYFGGVGKMFHALGTQFPKHLIFPGATAHMDVVWVMSTCLMTGLGFYMWPHMLGSAFSAKSARTIKRNAIIMPFYQIPILLVLMVGFTALMVLPRLANPDTAFLSLVDKAYPSWFMGFVGAAGAVTAMVPSAILVLFAATLLAKNVYQAGFNPGAGEKLVFRLSRAMVLVVMALALLLTLFFPNELVKLLIFGYDGVSQFFPGVVLGLFWKRVTKAAVWTGLTTGVTIVVVLIASRHDPFLGMNAGFVGLAVNAALTIAVSLLMRRTEAAQI